MCGPNFLLRRIFSLSGRKTPAKRRSLFCCGGGGGVSSNDRAEEMRLKAFACKKKQIDDVGGVEALVTSCTNCHRNGLRHGNSPLLSGEYSMAFFS